MTESPNNPHPKENKIFVFFPPHLNQSLHFLPQALSLARINDNKNIYLEETNY